jgi:hypothetical protein
MLLLCDKESDTGRIRRKCTEGYLEPDEKIMQAAPFICE